jgi:hypothetical protein
MTFTFSGTVRRISLDEFVTSAGGKMLAPAGTFVIESDGGALTAFTTRDGFIATFGHDPFATPPIEVLESPAESVLEQDPPPPPKPKRKRTPARAKG